MDAAFYRPALRAVRADAVAWIVKALEQSIHKLPPLVLPDTAKISQLSRCSQELLLASNQSRLDKASIRIIEVNQLRGSINRPRARIQIREEQNVHASLERLRDVYRLEAIKKIEYRELFRILGISTQILQRIVPDFGNQY